MIRILRFLLIMSVILIVGCVPKSDKQEIETESQVIEVTTQESEVTIANPMIQVDSSDDFNAIGISLKLPANTSWCQEPHYYIINQKIAEIQFFDSISEASGTIRAGSADNISGIYYELDTDRQVTWQVSLGEKTLYFPVTPIKPVDGHYGVLASWQMNDINYTVWEESTEHEVDPDVVGKLAIAIAQQSYEAD